MSIIKLINIDKYYGKNESKITALNRVNLEVEQGDMLAIMGPSGCGKSTLLNIIGCIDLPDEGEYFLDGQMISKLNFNKLSKIRNSKVSFIFQNFALLKDFNVLDNVMLPLKFRKGNNSSKKEIALKHLNRLGISSIKYKKVRELSGGQQQRVAIARALVQDSKIILADEPTGALDQTNGVNIIKILQELNTEGKTIIIVTHDPNIADRCSKVINMKDGVFV
jgi:putative ABC transport system ATP-binding protein